MIITAAFIMKTRPIFWSVFWKIRCCNVIHSKYLSEAKNIGNGKEKQKDGKTDERLL